jgi:cytochrome c-type protein NapB
VLACAAAAVAGACGGPPDAATVPRSTGQRAQARAYDGAPPTIPHDAAIGACATCHDADGAAIDGIGVAPASPHGEAALGAMQRCRQCHVPVATRTVLVASRFTGLAQGPWKGSRAMPGAPPTIPHPLQLRGECLTCHAGPGARAEIRTSHPERTRCRQCHVPDTPPIR